MTSSNGNIFRVTGPLCGEFTGPGEFPAQRPVARSFDVFFDLCLNKRLSKQSWGWWFGTLSRPLWRHCNYIDHNVTEVSIWCTCTVCHILFYSALCVKYNMVVTPPRWLTVFMPRSRDFSGDRWSDGLSTSFHVGTAHEWLIMTSAIRTKLLFFIGVKLKHKRNHQ